MKGSPESLALLGGWIAAPNVGAAITNGFAVGYVIVWAKASGSWKSRLAGIGGGSYIRRSHRCASRSIGELRAGGERAVMGVVGGSGR